METRKHVARGLGERGSMELPAFTDDLAVLVKRVRAGERAVLPGTD